MDLLCTPKGTEYLWQPLEPSAVEEMMKRDGIVKGNVAFSFDELVESDWESITDIACDRLIGSIYLQNIDSSVIAAQARYFNAE